MLDFVENKDAVILDLYLPGSKSFSNHALCEKILQLISANNVSISIISFRYKQSANFYIYARMRVVVLSVAPYLYSKNISLIRR